MPITLAEITRNAQNYLSEFAGTSGFENPQLWETVAVRAVDKIAAETDCILFHGRFALPEPNCYWEDITRYPVPPGFRIARNGFTRSWYATQTPIGILGFVTPGKAWEYDAPTSDALPLTFESLCPVPEWAIPAVEMTAALLRAKQFPGDNRDRIAMLESEVRDLQGDVEQRAAREYENAKRRIY